MFAGRPLMDNDTYESTPGLENYNNRLSGGILDGGDSLWRGDSLIVTSPIADSPLIASSNYPSFEENGAIAEFDETSLLANFKNLRIAREVDQRFLAPRDSSSGSSSSKGDGARLHLCTRDGARSLLCGRDGARSLLCGGDGGTKEDGYAKHICGGDGCGSSSTTVSDYVNKNRGDGRQFLQLCGDGASGGSSSIEFVKPPPDRRGADQGNPLDLNSGDEKIHVNETYDGNMMVGWQQYQGVDRKVIAPCGLLPELVAEDEEPRIIVPMLDSSKMQKFYKTKPCPWFPLGRCRMGLQCNWAHARSEMRPSVDLTRTKLCESFSKRGTCSNPNCRFAHSRGELRATSDYYKTSLCLFWMKGCCFVGRNCRYAHGLEDLRSKAERLQNIERDIDDPSNQLEGLSVRDGGLVSVPSGGCLSFRPPLSRRDDKAGHRLLMRLLMSDSSVDKKSETEKLANDKKLNFSNEQAYNQTRPALTNNGREARLHDTEIQRFSIWTTEPHPLSSTTAAAAAATDPYYETAAAAYMHGVPSPPTCKSGKTTGQRVFGDHREDETPPNGQIMGFLSKANKGGLLLEENLEDTSTTFTINNLASSKSETHAFGASNSSSNAAGASGQSCLQWAVGDVGTDDPFIMDFGGAKGACKNSAAWALAVDQLGRPIETPVMARRRYLKAAAAAAAAAAALQVSDEEGSSELRSDWQSICLRLPGGTPTYRSTATMASTRDGAVALPSGPLLDTYYYGRGHHFPQSQQNGGKTICQSTTTTTPLTSSSTILSSATTAAAAVCSCASSSQDEMMGLLLPPSEAA